MKNATSKEIVAIVVMAALALAYGCNSNKNNKHSIFDQQDTSVVSKLNAELQNAQSFNNLLMMYQDSLSEHSDPVMIEYYNGMIEQYDSAYHYSEALCQGYYDQLEEIHHCDMIAECESMMGNMAGHGGMMGGYGYSDTQNGHVCTIMEDIKDYCSTKEKLELDHQKYCTY